MARVGSELSCLHSSKAKYRNIDVEISKECAMFIDQSVVYHTGKCVTALVLPRNIEVPKP